MCIENEIASRSSRNDRSFFVNYKENDKIIEYQQELFESARYVPRVTSIEEQRIYNFKKKIKL